MLHSKRQNEDLQGLTPVFKKFRVVIQCLSETSSINVFKIVIAVYLSAQDVRQIHTLLRNTIVPNMTLQWNHRDNYAIIRHLATVAAGQGRRAHSSSSPVSHRGLVVYYL